MTYRAYKLAWKSKHCFQTTGFASLVEGSGGFFAFFPHKLTDVN